MELPFSFDAIQLSLPWKAAAAIAVSFASTLVLMPLACWTAHRMGIVDRPDGKRKLQKQPVALLGGVAVLAGLGITVLGAAAAGAMDDSLRAMALVSVGLSLLCAVGVIDDAFNIPPGWKLVAQILAGVPMIVAGCSVSGLDLGGVHIPLGPLGYLVALAWLVACTNAINLIDGMDGLCATVGLCIAAGVTGAALIGGSGNTLVCAAALAGSLAGFLVFNLPPARIYLGDAGSMVIGMTLGVITLHAAKGFDGAAKPVVLGALMFVPIIDVGLAMLRRRLGRQPIFQADRGHIHHRLLDHGLSVYQVLVCVAGIGITTSLIAVGTAYARSPLGGAVALAMVMLLLVNRKLVGHHEWTLLRDILARTATVPQEPVRPHLLRLDREEHAARHLHLPEAAEAATNAHRRAA